MRGCPASASGDLENWRSPKSGRGKQKVLAEHTFAWPTGIMSSDLPFVDDTYRIDDRRYEGLINCKGFLCSHNYHHVDTQRYAADWRSEVGALIIDLSMPL